MKTLQKIGTEKKRNWSNLKNEEKSPSLIGIERGNRYVRRFKLLFRDGRVMSIPYAHLPLFFYNPVGTLSIQTNEISVVIKGRTLGKLTDLFSEEKIQWIKESPSGIDDGETEVFIESIEVATENGI